MRVLVLRVKFGKSEYIDVCQTGEEAKELFLQIMKDCEKNNPDFDEGKSEEVCRRFNTHYGVYGLHGVSANCFVRDLDQPADYFGKIPVVG